MKKTIFTLAVLVMAFGNAGFAQRSNEVKTNTTANVLKHYGVRDESTIVPQEANWNTLEGEQYHTTYTYDEYDYYLIEEMTEWNYGAGWQDLSLLTYEYDFDGNVLEALVQMFEDGVWENEAKASYTYENGQLSEVIIQEYDNGEWVNETKEVYTYIGDVTTVLYWDWNGNNWSSNELYTYTYSGNSIELVIQYMQGGAWQNDEKMLFTLNFDEKVEEVIDQDWVGTSWVNEERTYYEYNDGVFTTKLVQNWDGSAWADDEKYSFAYDANGNATRGESVEMYGSSWIIADGDIEMAFGYGASSNEYYGTVAEVTYMDLMSLNENAQAVSFKAYPVPAEDEITILADNFQKAEIYSVTGQKLMESLQNKLDVSALAAGVYLLKVVDAEGNKAMQQIVVK